MSNWSNSDNKNYHANNDSIGMLKNFASIAKFDENIDLKLITRYLESAKNIIDVGSGYGRVLKYLSTFYPEKSLSALERSNVYFNHLTKYYSDTITLYHNDLLTAKFMVKFDLVLMLWSVLAEFNEQEQEIVINKYLDCLTKPGYLIIDMIVSTPKNMEVIRDTFIIGLNDQELQMNINQQPIINKIIAKSGQQMRVIEKIRYKIATGSSRILFVLARYTDTTA